MSYLSGFHIIPSLLPQDAQKTLLHRLFFRDLSNPNHKTNLNLHYKLPYHLLSNSTPSFFDILRTTLLEPLDPETHNPLPVEKMLNKKLRWMTLGGQYDWTQKEYPEKAPGEEVIFPSDIAELITRLVNHPSFLPMHSHTIAQGLHVPSNKTNTIIIPRSLTLSPVPKHNNPPSRNLKPLFTRRHAFPAPRHLRVFVCRTGQSFNRL